MPRVLDPRLDEALDRANPAVEMMVRLIAPDCESVLRRAGDQFFTAPPLVSESPAASGAASATGALVLASSASQIFNAATVASFRSLNSDPIGTRLKATGWSVDPAFGGGVLRKFSAYVQRNPYWSTLYLARDFTLQIYRATGVHLDFVTASGARTPVVQWTFTELLPNGGAVKRAAAIAGGWVSDRQWLDFDLTPYGVEVLPSTGKRFAPAVDGELEVYYFKVDVVNSPRTDLFRWLTDSTTTRVVAGIGTFQRREWSRDAATDDPYRDPWTETRSNDVHCCKVELEGYVASSQRVYVHDLGKVPEAASTGIVVFEAALPQGAGATMELSTAGSAGPWTAVKHGDPVTIQQQTYHSRLTLTAPASGRRTPAVSAFGLQWRQAFDVTAESIVEPPDHEVGMPFCESAIAQGRLSVLRTGVRDYEDTASDLAVSQPATQIEAELRVGSRHPAIGEDAWFLMDRIPVSQRAPTPTAEVFTLLSYQRKLSGKIPARAESINSVHTVVSAGAGGVSLTLDPAPAGAGTGHEYLNQGYYIRVRTSSTPDVPVGWVQTIENNSSADTMQFTAQPLPGVLSAGDIVEVHSGKFAQPVLQWVDADPADIWWEILTVQKQIPPARIGRADLGRAGRSGLPPRVTDRSSDPTTQRKLKVTNRFTEAQDADKLLDQISFIMGGVTTEIGGQIVFRQIYPLVDETGVVRVAPEPVSAVWDPRDYTGLDTPTGAEERIAVLACDYGVNKAAANPDAFPASTVVFADADAVAWLSQQDLDQFGASAVPDDIAAWLYNSEDAGLFLAEQLTQRVVSACSTGKRLWSWTTIDQHPARTIGDRVAIVTDTYTDYDPATKQQIRGWWAYTLVLVGVGSGGRRFKGFMLGLSPAAAQVKGGPGTLQGPNAPIPIPADFACSAVVLGSQTGPVGYVNATYTPSDPFLVQMVYSVRARPSGTTTWGAPSIVPGDNGGNDKIPGTPGTDVEVTPITVSAGNARVAGAGAEVKIVTLPPFPPPDLAAADITVVAGASAITYSVPDFRTAKYIRWWRQTFTDATVPASPISVETTGAEMPRFEAGRITSLQGGALDATNDWELVTLVAYDADSQPGVPIFLKTVRATPAVPSAPVSATPVSHTSSSVTNGVLMPGSVTNLDTIRIYRDGVQYGPDQSRTAGAGATQNVTSTGLPAGTAAQWRYSGVSAAGGESAKTAAITVSTDPGTLPTPSIVSVGYDTAAQAFYVNVAPGANTPTGVTWHVKVGTANPPTTEDTSAASTSTVLSSASAQTIIATTFYFKVWGTKTSWTPSAESAVASAVRPSNKA